MNRCRTTILLAALAGLAAVAPGCGEAGSAPSEATAGDAAETMSLGERAVSPFVDYGTSRQAEPTKVGVRVLRVRKGRPSELAPFKLTRAQRRAVPFYVEAEFENLGGFALSRNLLRASVEDAAGREHRPSTLVLLGGTFKPCPETPRAPLAPGRSYKACSPILLPKGVTPTRVRFQGDVAKDPLLWSART